MLTSRLPCAVLLFAALTGTAAQQPNPPVRFPAGQAPASSVTDLGPDRLYVIDSDVDAVVLTSPQGLVRVTRDEGPLRVRGRFVDGTGIETRQFKGKWVFSVEPVDGQAGEVELLVVPKGFKDESEILRRRVKVGLGPKPPPGPDVKPIDPEPKPEPKPKPVDPTAPIPISGFRVLIVFETGQALPAAQSSILYGKRTRDYLDQHCVKGPNGQTPEYRIYDKDVALGNESKLWRDAMARPRTSVPWVLISNGTTGYEGPLPATADEFIALCDKYRK